MDLLLQIGVLLFVGFVTSFVSGLFGIGGGIVRIPLFVYLLPWLGIPNHSLMHMAVGTSVALVIPTAIAASIKQHHQGNLDLAFCRTWAAGILIGVLVGLIIVPDVSTEYFQVIFVIFLVSVAVYVGFVPDTVAISKSPPTGPVKIVLASLIGLGATLTGTGGGALVTPSLKAFCMPLKKAVAIASATGLVVGVVAAIGYVWQGQGAPDRPPHSLGYVSLLVFAGMLPTIFIGAPLGVKVNNRLDDTTLKYTYAAFLIIAAANMLYKLLA